MRVPVLKTLDTKIRIGKYTLAEVLIPLLILIAIVVSEIGIVLKLFLVAILWELFQVVKLLKKRRVRAYALHIKYAFGIIQPRFYPKSYMKEFGG